MKTKLINYLLFGLFCYLPTFAQEVLPGYRYLSSYNEIFTASDELSPFMGEPTGTHGYYFTKAFGVYYALNFPWIYLDAYGWCYKTADELSIIYITGGRNLKINAPLDQEIHGWYRLENVYLVVPDEQSNNMAYWAQDLYSLEREETVHVNLGWMRHSLQYD